MIAFLLRRVGLGLAAAAVIATSAAIIIVALAFALYALTEPRLGRAGAAGVVAAAAALVSLLAGATLALAARAKPPTKLTPHGRDPASRILNFVKEKPVTAVAAALAAGFLAIRNPRYLGVAVRSFLEGREPPKR